MEQRLSSERSGLTLSGVPVTTNNWQLCFCFGWGKWRWDLSKEALRKPGSPSLGRVVLADCEALAPPTALNRIVDPRFSLGLPN